MFVVKIYKEKQLLDVIHYNIFQNALADIGDKSVFENIPKNLIDTLGNPEIYCFSRDEETNTADDFEFRYSNGVIVYLGEIFPIDMVRGQKETLYRQCRNDLLNIILKAVHPCVDCPSSENECINYTEEEREDCKAGHITLFDNMTYLDFYEWLRNLIE